MVKIKYFNIILLAMTACGGPNQETLLDELRVLAMVPDAPELAPGEATALRVRVVDPAETGAEVLVWTCTSLGEGCLEEAEGRAVEVLAPTDGWVEAQVAAPAALGFIASEEPVPLIAAWALACEAGRCPLIDDVKAGREIDPDRWEDPLAWMGSLDMVGVSLALNTLSVSTRGPDARHAAPTLEVQAALDPVAPEGTLTITAIASGALGPEAQVWAYTEGGGFVSTSERPDEAGEVRFDWIAPDAPGEVPLYLVLVDDLGGSALWEGAGQVEAGPGA